MRIEAAAYANAEPPRIELRLGAAVYLVPEGITFAQLGMALGRNPLREQAAANN